MALVYRIFPYDPTALAESPGHPLYLHKPQGRGRLDNPRYYETWYFGATPEVPVGEIFGDLQHWTDSMFEFPPLPNALRAMAVYELPDDLNLLDLDDARNLLDRGLRPTQVIERVRAETQSWAMRIFQEADSSGDRRWDGVKWWSFQRPSWQVIAVWVESGEPLPFELVDVENLDVTHPVVRAAARTLGRQLS